MKSGPSEKGPPGVHCSLAQEDWERNRVWHVWVIELREPKRGFTQLAVLLLRVRQPFHQAALMNELDAAAALAWVE